jgi:hypothetical protein
MLRTFLLDALLLTSLASAVALSPVKRQTGGVGIVFSGCDADQTAIINNALNDAVKMAYGIMGIDTKIVFAFLYSSQIQGMSNDYVALVSVLKDVVLVFSQAIYE